MPAFPRRLFVDAPRALWRMYRALPRATKALVTVCAGGYLLSSILGPLLYFYFGLVPYLLVKKFWLWQPVTYLFMHGSLWHLLFNVFMLWMLGRLVEPVMGTRNFLKFFFITGLGAALVNVLLTPLSPVPIVGASGAIYGLLLAFAVLYPDAMVYLYFVVPVRAKYLAVVLGVIEFLASFASSYTGIANLAHLGGLFTGYLYLKFFSPFVAAGKKESYYGEWDSTGYASSSEEAARLDALLDKVENEGLASLTGQERRRLDEISARLRR